MDMAYAEESQNDETNIVVILVIMDMAYATNLYVESL